MPTGKRAKALMTAVLVGAATTATASTAQAQSTEQMLRMIQDLNAKVEQLTEQVQAAQITADSADTKAAAAQKNAGGDAKFKWGPSPTIQSAEYKFEIDFATNEVDITDAYLEYAGWDPFYILVGNAKTPNSLEELTSSRHISMVERGGFTDAFNFERRLGIQTGYVGEWFRADAAITGAALGSPDANFNDEGYSIGARIAAYPQVAGGIVHVGASVLYRSFSNDVNTLSTRYRQRPHSHLSGIRYVDTNNLTAKSDLFVGVELAGAFGPFWAESEWSWLKAKGLVGHPETSATFQGGYFGLGWFITGEERGYKEGTWDRPKKVNNPVFEGGWGAWALVGRVDYVDLNDSFGGSGCVSAASGICGGTQLTYIAGVNWYLNRHTVIKLNYAHSNIRNAWDNLGDTFPNGKNKVDSFVARFQVDW